jgi:hypothetical protein
MEELRPHHTYKIQRRLSNTPAASLLAAAFWQKKLIRAAHAKEKQLPEELVQPPESP